ncbi:DUF5696 domain-containing protein [Paenibacillus sp. BC26]|uniref:DUF5696 domain-containing protein n=1 Tax=Paenibacillus sp. BC26 TaxID=1881032 RepID=UPI0008E938B1|nr:DUF5696 domain-containing protein [Paenibacillus sp. BC26]SFS74046.1 hypothetical protein SAMN05428962_2567 [Paenibacillus sp. BC26]
MHKRITTFLLVIMLVLSVLTACGIPNDYNHDRNLDRSSATPLTLEGNDFVKVAENDNLELLLNPDNSEAAVKDKKTGRMWYTNPPAKSGDAIATGVNSSELASQFIIQYADKANHISTANNYELSVANKQFKFYQTDHGVKVDYLLQPKGEVTYMPRAVTKDDYEKIILPKFPKARDKNSLKNAYNKVVMAKESAKRREDIIAQYPLAANMDEIYMMFGSVSNTGLTRISKLFEEAGFTLEDKQAFETKMGMVETEAVKWFTISVEYSLDKDNLVVSVPTSDIRSSKELIVTGITFLPFFGAGQAKEEGYLFIPDGSGAIVDFKDNKPFKSEFNMKYYGNDNALDISSQTVTMQNMHLPVLGIKTGDQSYLGILEDGAALASLQINKAGRINEYNSLGLLYSIHENNTVGLQSLSSIAEVRVYQKTAYKGTYKVRYAFFVGDNANYSGMASYYRNYLQQSGKLNKPNEVNELKKKKELHTYPFYFNLVGSVNKKASFLGFPRDTEIGLTTFDQAGDILRQLAEKGVKDRVVKYTGWMEGGISNTDPDYVNPSSTLGGKKGLNRFLTTTAEQNIGVYFDWNGSYRNTIRNSWFDSFRESRDAAQFITQKTAYKRSFSISTGNVNRKEAWYIYNPEYKKKLSDQFNASLQKNNKINGIALEYEGLDLNSDFVDENQYDRTMSQQNDEAVMREFADNVALMASGTNSYALPYVSFIDRMPSTSSMLDFYTYDVPFYQLVVHGLIPYATAPINQTQATPQVELLKLLETGSIPSWMWVYGGSEELKDSNFNYLYSLDYQIWFDEAVRIYNEARGVLEPLADVQMVNHERLLDDVYKVTYANNTSIYINYRPSEVTVDSMNLAAQSYKVIH